jgi:hypothetical protein
MVMHVSQLNSIQLLRLSDWFKGKGQNLVDELMKTAGELTPEQEKVANGDTIQGGRDDPRG